MYHIFGGSGERSAPAIQPVSFATAPHPNATPCMYWCESSDLLLTLWLIIFHLFVVYFRVAAIFRSSGSDGSDGSEGMNAIRCILFFFFRAPFFCLLRATIRHKNGNSDNNNKKHFIGFRLSRQQKRARGCPYCTMKSQNYTLLPMFTPRRQFLPNFRVRFFPVLSNFCLALALFLLLGSMSLLIW